MEKLEINRYKCTTCKKQFFTTFDGFIQHTATHTSRKDNNIEQDGTAKHSCECGSTSGNTENSSAFYQKNVRFQGGYRIGAAFDNTQSVPRSCKAIKSDKQKRYTCKTCGKILANARTLEYHERIHRGERPHQCDMCCLKFTSPGSLLNHKKLHERGKKLVSQKEIGKANKLLTSKTAATGTGKKHHQAYPNDRKTMAKKSYKCDFCDRNFSGARYLRNHLKIHSGDLEFECKHCRIKFIHAINLKHHMKAHDPGGNISAKKEMKNKAKSKPCTVKEPGPNNHSSKSGNQRSGGNSLQGFQVEYGRSSYDDHGTTRNDGERPHRCLLCGEQFRSQKHLEYHTWLHNNETAYQHNFYQRHCESPHHPADYYQRKYNPAHHNFNATHKPTLSSGNPTYVIVLPNYIPQ